jgi:proline dehydrogenase
MVADGLLACRGLYHRGFDGLLGFWPGRDDQPRKVADVYGDAIEGLAGEPLDGQMCVSVPALGFSRDLLSEVLERSRRNDVGLHFDSPGLEAAGRTFSLITWAISKKGELGCTLPGRWRRSLHDAELALDLGLNVRVVKGQWSERDGDNVNPREGFLAVVDRLAGRARHVAVATHDAALAREALRRLRAADTSCELELMFGLPLSRALQVASEARVTVRMYVPYGRAWLPYSLSSVVEEPQVLWWFLRDLVVNRSTSWAGRGFPVGPATPAAV